jgi:hypothetical protein
MKEEKTLWGGFKSFIANCASKNIDKFKYQDVVRYIVRVYADGVTQEDEKLYNAVMNINDSSTLRNYITYCFKTGYLKRTSIGTYIIADSLPNVTVTKLIKQIQEEVIRQKSK